MSRKMTDLRNKKYDALWVRDKVTKDRGGHVLWECYCVCGERIIVRGDNLTSGRTKSCGCKSHREGITWDNYLWCMCEIPDTDNKRIWDENG